MRSKLNTLSAALAGPLLGCFFHVEIIVSQISSFSIILLYLIQSDSFSTTEIRNSNRNWCDFWITQNVVSQDFPDSLWGSGPPRSQNAFAWMHQGTGSRSPPERERQVFWRSAQMFRFTIFWNWLSKHLTRIPTERDLCLASKTFRKHFSVSKITHNCTQKAVLKRLIKEFPKCRSVSV